MGRADRISFAVITLTIIIVGASGLSTPFIAVLFAYLALSLIDSFVHRPWLSVVIFTVLVIGIFSGFVVITRHALVALPHIAATSIPMLLDYAKAHDLDAMLPFEDSESFRAVILDTIKGELGSFAKYANVMTREFVSLIIALVVAASLFFNSELDLDKDRHPKKNNMYSNISLAISERFVRFYRSFATVMGAQLLISSINTFFTGLYVFFANIPHGPVIVLVTFLCGLLPIVGNLISNTIIFFISFTISIKVAVSSLVFLIALHKFEYFLNSKIIGSRIRNPMWLTLIGLVVGEKLIGIPGMILAPVVLNYVKVESSDIEYPN